MTSYTCSLCCLLFSISYFSLFLWSCSSFSFLCSRVSCIYKKKKSLCNLDISTFFVQYFFPIFFSAKENIFLSFSRGSVFEERWILYLSSLLSLLSSKVGSEAIYCGVLISLWTKILPALFFHLLAAFRNNFSYLNALMVIDLTLLLGSSEIFPIIRFLQISMLFSFPC